MYESLPSPLNKFEVDLPKNTYKDFNLSPESDYPLAGVTYPVDYGYIPGYTGEDGHELDLFFGSGQGDKMGFVLVHRGTNNPDEHKFYINLTEEELSQVLSELGPVLVNHEKIESLEDFLGILEEFKDK